VGAHGISCRRHQHIALALQKFLRHCYETISTQVHYEWRLPNNDNGKHQRMDVVVDTGNTMVLFDVVVTSPCTTTNLTTNRSDLVPLASSAACIVRKKSAFLRVYPPGSQHHHLNDQLVPIALESTGAFAPATLTSLNNLVKQARTRGEAFGTEAAKALKAFFRTVAVILTRDRAASLGHFQSRVIRIPAQDINPLEQLTERSEVSQDLFHPNAAPPLFHPLHRPRDPSPTLDMIRVELRVTEHILHHSHRIHSSQPPTRRASLSYQPNLPTIPTIHRSTAEDMDREDYDLAVRHSHSSPD
jgi:hypothetical protein